MLTMLGLCFFCGWLHLIILCTISTVYDHHAFVNSLALSVTGAIGKRLFDSDLQYYW